MVEFGVSLPTGREGLMVPTGFASKITILEAGMLAENLGFQSVWGNDHITVQKYVRHLRPKPSFYEPIISMAALSSVTRKIKLATGVLVLPWRAPTIVVYAKQLATLDVLSEGKLIIGIGSGAYIEESRALGIKNNLEMMKESVKALRVLFDEDISTFEGKYINFRDIEFLPKPVQKPLPIYLGRHLTSNKVLRWTAKHMQGWIPGLSPEQFAETIPRLKVMLKEYGRNFSELDIVREISVSHADSREKAFHKYLATPAQAHMKSLSEGKQITTFDEETKYSLIGTADDIIEGILSYLDVGVKHFMFNFAVTKPDDLKHCMIKFAEEIMPSF